MLKSADVVAGLAWGDEGKGKITSYLASSGKYNYVCRWAGGSNAGHTVYINENKYKTHVIPSGVFHGIPSIIGPSCVINKTSLYSELEYLHDNGFDIHLVKISPRAHIVTDEHILLDRERLAPALGTTGSGIAPAYADKAARCGVRAEDYLPKSMIWDEKLEGNVLCEGAQGVWLDLDWGNYPYVTSSTTLPYGACSLGIPPQKINRIYGVAKIYDTRSGTDPIFPESLLEDQILSRLADLGEEVGVTTGRRRKVQWLNLDKLIHSVNMTGTTDLIINKCDILDKLGVYKIIYNGRVAQFNSLTDMIGFVKARLSERCHLLKNKLFSSSPLTL
ncbi:MAG: hypothetical protein CMQ41_07815 [Gammaproteobacteria bacterium]|nr:hypothetical protein [Gammaproteobacteria bacterium]